MSDLQTAIAIAVEAHAGQVDRGGTPYILHPLRVMLAVEPRDRIAAVLHDVIEDCPAYPADRLAVAGFLPEVLETLDALTKRPGEPYEAFICRLAPNRSARAVKLADLRDNSDLTRLRGVTDKDRERFVKYAAAIATLS